MNKENHAPRVLFVDQTGQLGGAELSLLDVARRVGERGKVVVFEGGPLVERLREAGVEVEVLTAGAGVRQVKKDAGWFAQGKALGGLGVLTWRLSRRAKRWRADVIYANTAKAFVVAALASVCSRPALVYHLHDMLSASHFSRANRRLVVTLANRLTKRVIANSEATRNAFVDAGGDPTRTTVIHNGLDPTPFDAVEDERVAQVRRDMGINDRPVIGMFARLAHWKGQHVLIDALAKLADTAGEGGQVHTLVVGGALFGEGDYAEQLQKQTRRLGLSDRVHFLGFREDVPALMKACDVVVHCSICPEPFGRVIVEAMLAGRPVIASAAGGAKQILTPDVDLAEPPGLLIAPNDANALAKALGQLFANDSTTRAMAQRGQDHARKHFTLHPILESIETVIGEVSPTTTAGSTSDVHFSPAPR